MAERKDLKYVKEVIGATALLEKFERVKKKVVELFEAKFHCESMECMEFYQTAKKAVEAGTKVALDNNCVTKNMPPTSVPLARKPPRPSKATSIALAPLTVVAIAQYDRFLKYLSSLAPARSQSHPTFTPIPPNMLNWIVGMPKNLFNENIIATPSTTPKV